MPNFGKGLCPTDSFWTAGEITRSFKIINRNTGFGSKPNCRHEQDKSKTKYSPQHGKKIILTSKGRKCSPQKEKKLMLIPPPSKKKNQKMLTTITEDNNAHLKKGKEKRKTNLKL